MLFIMMDRGVEEVWGGATVQCTTFLPLGIIFLNKTLFFFTFLKLFYMAVKVLGLVWEKTMLDKGIVGEFSIEMNHFYLCWHILQVY